MPFPAMLLAFLVQLRLDSEFLGLVGNPPGQILCSCSILGYEWGHSLPPGPVQLPPHPSPLFNSGSKHPLTSPEGNRSHPSPPGQGDRGDTDPCQGGTGWGSGCVHGAEEAAGAAGSLLGTARWQAGSAVPLSLAEGPGSPWDAQGGDMSLRNLGLSQQQFLPGNGVPGAGGLCPRALPGTWGVLGRVVGSGGIWQPCWLKGRRFFFSPRAVCVFVGCRHRQRVCALCSWCRGGVWEGNGDLAVPV